MKILFPLLNGTQLNSVLLENLLRHVETRASQIVLLLVIDAVDLENKPFGFAANDITDGNALMAEVSSALKKENLIVTELLEWGDTLEKIDVVSRRENCEKIVFQKQSSRHFFDLIQKLSDLNSIEIILIDEKETSSDDSANSEIKFGKSAKPSDKSEIKNETSTDGSENKSVNDALNEIDFENENNFENARKENNSKSNSENSSSKNQRENNTGIGSVF